MATVGTATAADTLAGPGSPPIARGNQGGLYVVARTSATVIQVWRSSNFGASWATFGSAITVTGLQELSSLVIDAYGYLHLAYRVGTTGGGGVDTLWYRRLGVYTAAWSTALQVSGSPANGGTPGTRFQAVDLAVYHKADSSYAIIVGGAYADTAGAGARHGIYLHGVSISTSGAITLNNGLIAGTRAWFAAGTPGRSGISLELEHNGDGQTASTPHLWVSWGRAELSMVKVAWSKSSWQGPSSAVAVRSTLPTSQDFSVGRWDGLQWLMPVPSPDDSSVVRIYQRNRANTTTTTLDSPQHPQGTVKNIDVTYDLTTRNVRLFAVGTSAATLYYVDYTRATQTWGTWTLFSATAITASTEWGLRRGGNEGNALWDVITTSGSANPWTITHTAQTTTTAPKISSFVTSGAPYSSGSAANVGASLALAWTFSDADPGQTQGSYALSRQIGAGALAYWNATSSTWVASQVQNTSIVQGVTLASTWGVDGDPAHQYKVLVWDSAGTVAPGYSAALQLYPSAQVNPAITAPLAAAVLTTDSVTVTWTAAEQTGIRIVVTQTAPTAEVVHDSGVLMGYTDTTYTVPKSLLNGSAHTVTLYTYNADQLVSAGQTRSFTVAYAAVPAPTAAPVAVPASGIIQVTATNPAPVGTQPALVDQDLYRRAKITSPLNANTTFAGNTTGWQVSGGGTPGTLTYSTAQSVSGPGSGRMVPSGSVAVPLVDHVTAATIVAGQLYLGTGWIRPDTGNKPVRICLEWFTVADAYLGETVTSVTAIAGAWQYLEVVGDPAAFPTAAKVRVAMGESGTPASGDAFYLDNVELEVFNPDIGVRVAAQVDAGAVVGDWRATGQVDWEYRWAAKGANGTTQTGPWT